MTRTRAMLVLLVCGLRTAESRGLGTPPEPAPSNDAPPGMARVRRCLFEADRSPAERIAPYDESLRGPLLGYLEIMRTKGDWKELECDPEVFRVGDEVHFLVPLTFEGQTVTFCFSFVLKEDTWFFQHMESITIRLDRIGPLPRRASRTSRKTPKRGSARSCR